MPRKRKPRGRSASPDWKSTAEMCEILGCSRDHLQSLRMQGILKHKTHWRNISPYAIRPTYRYHAARCQKAIEQSQDDLYDAAKDGTI